MIKFNMSFRFFLNKLKLIFSKELSDLVVLKFLQDVFNIDDRELVNIEEEVEFYV